MMKLNNENYEIWKILMEAILVCKQLRDVALGTTPRPARPLNTIRTWDQKNQEAHAELQLAVEWDQLVSRTYYFIQVDGRQRGLGVEGDCSKGRGGTGVGKIGQRQGAE